MIKLTLFLIRLNTISYFIDIVLLVFTLVLVYFNKEILFQIIQIYPIKYLLFLLMTVSIFAVYVI